MTEVTYDRWRHEHGGLKSDPIKRMKAIELENRRLGKATASLTLDKLILAEAAREPPGTFRHDSTNVLLLGADRAELAGQTGVPDQLAAWLSA